MSRNLCEDRCTKCHTLVRLSDLIGQPLEFRKYHDYRPRAGVKWICPKCGTVYFCAINIGSNFWGHTQEELKRFNQDELDYGHGIPKHKNREKVKFAKELIGHNGESRIENLGW